MISFGCMMHACAGGCISIYVHIWLHTHMHIYKHVHQASPEPLCLQILSSHSLAGQNCFLPISSILWMCLAKAFRPGSFWCCSRWFLIAVVPPLWSHSPQSTPSTIPVSCGMIPASDMKLSHLGPANTSSCLCYFSLTLVMTSPGCQFVSSLDFQSFHHRYKQYSAPSALSPKSSHVASWVRDMQRKRLKLTWPSEILFQSPVSWELCYISPLIEFTLA